MSDEKQEQTSEKEPEQAGAQNKDPDTDILVDDRQIRGPLIWAALIFIPIIFAMIVALMQKEPVESAQPQITQGQTVESVQTKNPVKRFGPTGRSR